MRRHKCRWAVRMSYEPRKAVFVCEVRRNGLLVASADDSDYYLALAEGYGRARGVIRTMRVLPRPRNTPARAWL